MDNGNNGEDVIVKYDAFEKGVMVETLGSCGQDVEEEGEKAAFVSAALRQDTSKEPCLLMGVWEYDPRKLLSVLSLTPAQAKALGFGLINLANTLEEAVAEGRYGDQEIPDAHVYTLPPRL